MNQGYQIKQDYLIKLHDDLDELQKPYDTAWSSSFKERTEEKIATKREKIAGLENDIEDIKLKITESEKNIAGFPARLLDAEYSVEELQIKIKAVKAILGSGKIIGNPASFRIRWAKY